VGGWEGVHTDARNTYTRTGDGAVDTGLQNEEHAQVHNEFQVYKKYQQRLVDSLLRAAGSAHQRQ
jgi:restriction endonuclease Mrr